MPLLAQLKIACLAVGSAAMDGNSEYCSRLLLSGQHADEPQGQLMGHYILEAETNLGGGGRPVYEQKATSCSRVKLSTVAQNIGQGGNNDEEILMCEKKFDAKVAYLYYDAAKEIWKIGTELGSEKANLAVKSKERFPEKIHEVWSVSDPRAKIPWVQAPNVTLTCEDTKQKLEHFHHAHNIRMNLPYDRQVDAVCLGWKATKGCDPGGMREPESDRPCGFNIASPDWEGYCECAAGRREEYPCGHSPLNCSFACSLTQHTFPLVLGESSESWQSDQMAHNLVSAPGAGKSGWLATNATDQWVVFDLGPQPPVVQKVSLQLEGTASNPKTVSLEWGPLASGPWSAVVKFQVPSAKSKRVEQLLPTNAKYKSRYWRLYIHDNWGAAWGVGAKNVHFIFFPGERAKQLQAWHKEDDTIRQETIKAQAEFEKHQKELRQFLRSEKEAAKRKQQERQGEGEGGGKKYKGVVLPTPKPGRKKVELPTPSTSTTASKASKASKASSKSQGRGKGGGASAAGAVSEEGQFVLFAVLGLGCIGVVGYVVWKVSQPAAAPVVGDYEPVSTQGAGAEGGASGGGEAGGGRQPAREIEMQQTARPERSRGVGKGGGSTGMRMRSRSPKDRV